MAMLSSSLKSLVPLLLVLVIGTDMYGQRTEKEGHGQPAQFSIGPRLDLVGGGATTDVDGDASTGNVGVTGATSSQQHINSYYYQILPSLEMNASGQRSVLHFSYAFGLTEDKSSPFGNTKSHVATTTFSSSIGRDWKINISDSFARTSNLAAFDASRGTITPVPNGFNYSYFASGVNQIGENNSLQAHIDYGLTSRSTLSLTGSYALLKYPNGDAFTGALSNQRSSSVGVAYRQRMSDRDSWTLQYNTAYFTFTNYDNTQSQTINVGYMHQFAHELQFQASAGPSYVNSPGTKSSYASYNASATLQKTVKADTLSIYYTQASGDATGLGSISNSRNAGVALNHLIGKTMNLSTNISAFDTQGELGNIYTSRGVSATAIVGIAVNRTVSVNWGGQYQRYDQVAPFGFDQKRLFISLRYSDPGLWRTSR